MKWYSSPASHVPSASWIIASSNDCMPSLDLSRLRIEIVGWWVGGLVGWWVGGLVGLCGRMVEQQDNAYLPGSARRGLNESLSASMSCCGLRVYTIFRETVLATPSSISFAHTFSPSAAEAPAAAVSQ